MLYYLMSLDKPIVEVEMHRGRMYKVIKYLNKNYLPIGIKNEDSLVHWYEGRRIPSSRKNLELLQESTGISLDGILEKSLALSLSDSYWIKPKESDLTWAEVNFFDNPFSDDIGEFLISGEGNIGTVISPLNTTDGIFPKKWKIIDGVRTLIKSKSDNGYEHLNEILASKILEILTRNNRVPYVKYTKFNSTSCSCPCFIKNGENLVSVYYLLLNAGKLEPTNSKLYFEYLKYIFGVDYLKTMIISDYIIMNKDRHLKNISVIQDAKTNQIESYAPIFDNGFSLLSVLKLESEEPFLNRNFPSKPFAGMHNSQIELVENNYLREELKELYKSFYNIFMNVFENNGISNEILDGLAILILERINYLIKR